MASSKERFYPETRFGGFTDVDGTVAFFNRVNALLAPSFVVLDVGCGRGAYGEDAVSLRKELRILKGKVAKVVGIDLDPAARDNPYVDEFHLIQGDRWPIDDESVDLVLSDNVVEHVEDPQKFFAEIGRVLKRGGYLCIRTPNRWSYVGLASTLTPNKHHSKVTSVVQEGRKAEDVFPTVYRCNSVRKLKRIMREGGFESVVYGYDAEPGYLSFSSVAYALGVLHQRIAPGFLRPSLFAFGRKTGVA
jgi:SAM-dependent methyltransferase